MKKVFVIHGFEGSPNGGWRPWLMAELQQRDVYACALAMPTPDTPACDEWVAEVARHIPPHNPDQFYLVGHSLGVPTILQYLQMSGAQTIAGAILVSGPIDSVGTRALESFFSIPFDYALIKAQCRNFAVIHGEDDPSVPVDHAHQLARALGCTLTLIPHGGHLNGSAGWSALQPVMDTLDNMIR